MTSPLRTNLLALMKEAGDDAYSLAEKSGVPQPTTQRFLSGKHGDPRSPTVKKWAKAYGKTESQLRGDMPMDAAMVPDTPAGMHAVIADRILEGLSPLLLGRNGVLEAMAAKIDALEQENAKLKAENAKQNNSGRNVKKA